MPDPRRRERPSAAINESAAQMRAQPEQNALRLSVC